MATNKTNKSFTKRLRVTKKGKVLARKVGKGHFNAKHSGSKKMEGRSLKKLQITKKTLEANV